MKLLTLDISLIGTVKKIKRKIQITDDYNLNALHIAIQEMFCFNYDLEHEFEFKNVVYLPKIDHDFDELENMQTILSEEMEKLIENGVDIENLYNTKKMYKDDCTTTLSALNLKVGESFDYTYDQENNYEIVIELIQTNPAKESKIAIVDIKGKFVPQGLDVEMYNQLKSQKSGEMYNQLIEFEEVFDKKIIIENVETITPSTTMYE